MDQFSHEELQKVIIKYDSTHKQNRVKLMELTQELEDKNAQLA